MDQVVGAMKGPVAFIVTFAVSISFPLSTEGSEEGNYLKPLLKLSSDFILDLNGNN